MSYRNQQCFSLPPSNRAFYLKTLHWASRHFDTCVFLNSNNYQLDSYAATPLAFGLGAAASWASDGRSGFEGFKGFADSHDDWMFGFLSYELKNQLENLQSKNPDRLGFPAAHFFRPVILILPGKGEMLIGCLPGHGRLSDPSVVYYDIMASEPPPSTRGISSVIRRRIDRENYLRQVGAIKEHIQAGDIYEMNYCMEFFAENVHADPLEVYDALNLASPTPFSCFYMLDNKFLMCASPERFLRKKGQKLISQPMKGTMGRGGTKAEDLMLKQALHNDPKERSENVMIVDLVRNDLSRTALKNSVCVEELFGIYSFRQVHQMISTITSRLRPGLHYLDAVRHAFPMGSMTGAPKIRAMQLIDQYEDHCRGLFSGAVGYISPEKDFDFNVVIRSILYNRKNMYLAYLAGSAITSGSVPDKEYEECLLKAASMGKAIGNPGLLLP